MKKFILKRRTITVLPYNYDIHVIFTNDIRRAVVKLAKEMGEDVTARLKDNMHALTVYSSGCSDVFNFFDKTPDVGTLSHEIFHSIDFILNDVGIKYEHDVTDEVWAYQLGDTMRQVTMFYHEVNSRNKVQPK